MPFLTQKRINWACDTIGDLLREWQRLHNENESLKREIQQLKRSRTMMRAKMLVSSVETTTYGETIKAAPVCGNNPFGPNGESEDNTFARFTPSGSLSLTVNNPDLLGKIKPGQKLYVDFTLAE
jgi:FtsZ-binding cell division protein ZapB